jgi:2-oxoacid:acceptor oxidoreductase gamma subunit (pyruvate/2-ketoisovalerate family)
MIEIRFHGRGGQGAVTSSQILAIAAFYSGKQCQSFPNFGVERTGAPVESFVRIDEKQIFVRQHVYEPDIVIVLDPTLIAQGIEVTKGLKQKGLVIVNTDKTASDLALKGNFSIKCINITKIAMETIGKPFVNIASLGAFCALNDSVSLDSLKKAIAEKMAAKPAVVELNQKAAEAVYNAAKTK